MSSWAEATIGYQKDDFQQTCDCCGAVFRVEVPGQKDVKSLKSITALSAIKSSREVHQILQGFPSYQNEPMDLLDRAQSRPNPVLNRDGAKARSHLLTFGQNMKEQHVLADNSNSAQRRNGMNAGIKLAAVYVAVAILVAGCGQSNSGSTGTSPSQPAAAQPQSSQSSPQKTSEITIDGYKSFKFGMKPSELAKLEECAPNDYDEQIANSIVKLTEKQGALSPYDEKILDELKNNKEGSYSEILHCKVNFAGEVRGVYKLNFNHQMQLERVVLNMGDFLQERKDSLIKELSGKYPLSSEPSDLDIAAFNKRETHQISWLFANGSVELLTYDWGKGMYDKATLWTLLAYNDAMSAKRQSDLAHKGQVSSSDL